MNLEAERKAFIGEMAAQVLTMGAEDFLHLKALFSSNKKEEIEHTKWFDANLSSIREAIQRSHQDAEKGRFLSHDEVQQKARKILGK
ncbi:MAG: hypothetical protein AAGG68_22285 [Bacteroidota bacterium]